MSFEPDGRKVTGRFYRQYLGGNSNAVATAVGVVALFIIAPLFGVSPRKKQIPLCICWLVPFGCYSCHLKSLLSV